MFNFFKFFKFLTTKEMEKTFLLFLWPLSRSRIRLQHCVETPPALPDAKEEMDQNWYNLLNLKQFIFRLFPFLQDCYKINQHFLETSSDHHYYYCYSRNRYTGQKNEISLKDMIEYREDIKKEMVKKNIFIFFN